MMVLFSLLLMWSLSSSHATSECALTEKRFSELLGEDENMRLDDPRVRQKETAERRRMLNRQDAPPERFEVFYDDMQHSVEGAHYCGMKNYTSHADCTHYIGMQSPYINDQLSVFDDYGLEPCFSKEPGDGSNYWYV